MIAGICKYSYVVATPYRITEIFGDTIVVDACKVLLQCIVKQAEWTDDCEFWFDFYAFRYVSFHGNVGVGGGSLFKL